LSESVSERRLAAAFVQQRLQLAQPSPVAGCVYTDLELFQFVDGEAASRYRIGKQRPQFSFAVITAHTHRTELHRR
jgi:hypothetical protein